MDIEHAGRMRQALAIENPDLAIENYKYIVRITGDDNEGKREVDKLMAMIDQLEKQVSERKDQSEMLMQSVLREAFAG